MPACSTLKCTRHYAAGVTGLSRCTTARSPCCMSGSLLSQSIPAGPRSSHRRLCRRAQRAALRCHGQQEGSEPGEELDFAFFAKLTASAVIGAAAIKYGSLSYDLPFQPNFPAALSLIFGPCVVYSVYFLLKQKA